MGNWGLGIVRLVLWLFVPQRSEIRQDWFRLGWENLLWLLDREDDDVDGNVDAREDVDVRVGGDVDVRVSGDAGVGAGVDGNVNVLNL
jgi:hypothetical protein